MTIGVTVDDNNIIRETPPIAHKFIGQHIDNLINWMKSFGQFMMQEIKQ